MELLSSMNLQNGLTYLSILFYNTELFTVLLPQCMHNAEIQPPGVLERRCNTIQICALQRVIKVLIARNERNEVNEVNEVILSSRKMMIQSKVCENHCDGF